MTAQRKPGSMNLAIGLQATKQRRREMPGWLGAILVLLVYVLMGALEGMAK